MEWTVSEVAERAGISGRTLRHYHRIGLLSPDRIGSNGYRYYGFNALARLNRILLLREAGMPLADIAAVLTADQSSAAEVNALQKHLGQLVQEHCALERRIAEVEHTIEMRRQGREPRIDVLLSGFNDGYESEVVQRWGREAFDASNRWWHHKSVQQQREWKYNAEALLTRWRELHEGGFTPGSEAAQRHAATHIAWFAEIPGTPSHAGDSVRSAAMVHGIADLYESEPDFHDAFGSREAAHFAAMALRLHMRHFS